MGNPGGGSNKNHQSSHPAFIMEEEAKLKEREGGGYSNVNSQQSKNARMRNGVGSQQ